ncbi:hypothetical protein [Corynebacterium sp.]|uniref:hypothetical protein n=1 Tax=Corynebacterium sp. TaxID=1720 RepID=UPI0026DCE783|nr:hypothetical protein [Corynebacterium sp.]MDO5032482.1 hypothetical protein [Corynebacterium sp.]
MRKFRTAAVAAATALTVSVAGISVASAADDTPKEETTKSELSSAFDQVKENDSDQSLSSKWGEATGADTEVGKDEIVNKPNEDTPLYGKVWHGTTYAAVAAAIFGILTAAYNAAVYNGILPNHILDPIFKK